jgi:hypothetical protein
MKMLDKIIKVLFGDKKPIIDAKDAIHCAACKVWYLRVHDILEIQRKDKLKNLMINGVMLLITLSAISGKLSVFLDLVFEIIKKKI